ncbi:MAG: protein kinase [Candidatus Riflebacteria bacterium]|nr:protein kinase [Candidatus Riflebacteria bacterium]
MFKLEQIIGRHFKILSQLGAGGMGQVYKALDINLGREVAIKFLLAEIAKEEEIVSRFLNEGRVLATINHPAVISVYASDVEEGGIPFLVMEFVDGKSLGCHKEALKDEPITLVNHFIQLLSGIHSCHQKGIIHRDLKPENVLINKEGQLKIVDFGIAKTANRHTKTGIAIGTPHYMSPEQCLGKADITAKTDVYAAGVMLFEMLTGRLPFNIECHATDPALAIALMHLNDTPDFKDFAQVVQGDSFKALIAKMLAKKPDERPEIPEILETLKQILKRLRVAEGQTDQTTSTTATVGEIYQIQQELGAGGMGKVYKALDTSLNRIVAIKVLHNTTSGDSPLIERFIREGQTLATVGHRNVMGIYASGRDNTTGRPFLVMEYIEGKPLTQLKQAINKDCRQAVPIMLQLAEGIAACHERNIIHRDLKPANIIITPTGLVKIIDFGIAKTQTSLTKTGMTVGTPEYMSPEQCTGSRNISGKSDIYSLGIIFWELIFGHVPFKADGQHNAELSIALKHIEATLPAQLAIPDMTMVPIISLVRRMLDKDQAARPATSAIINTLEDWLIEHAPESMPHSPTSRRSTSRSGISSLSGLVNATDQPTSSKKYILPAALVVLLGIGGLAIRYGTGGDASAEAKAAEINELINSQNFVEARRQFDEFAATDEGRKHTPAIKEKFIQALIGTAETAESNKDYETAIKLFGQAIALDPTNPKAALTLSRLQQEKEKYDRLLARINVLNTTALALIGKLEPASGTRELQAIMQELESLDLASVSAEISGAWKARFINLGEQSLSSNPQKSLAYYQDLQKYFPDTEGLEDLAKDAESRAKQQEEGLAQATMLSTLKTALTTAIDNYVPGQKPDLICQRIMRVQELGDPDAADAFSRKLGEKIASEADNWIVSNPLKAIALFSEAKNACPILPGLDTKVKLAEESLASMRSSEEIEKERNDLSAAIAQQIKAINPPESIENVLQEIDRLSTYGESASLVEKHRDALYQKYFAKTSELIEKSPAEALKNLQTCIQIKPDAPGLNDVKNQIEARIQVEEERRAAEEKRERDERQAKITNDIFAQIKKADIPTDVAEIRESITAMLREFADSDAANKLEQHLINRCNEELKKLENSAPDKAITLADQLKSAYSDNTVYQNELSELATRVAEKARQAATQRAIGTHAAGIRKFADNPQADKVAEVLKLFEEIKGLDASYDTETLMREVVEKIRDRVQQAKNTKEAEDILKVLQSFDKSGNINISQELAKLAETKLSDAESRIKKFKPGKDIAPVLNSLGEFDNWNQKDKKGVLIGQTRDNYVKIINETSEKSAEDALLLLRQLYKLPGLDSDAKLKALEQTLIKLDTEQKTPKVDPRVEEYSSQIEQIISMNQVLQQTDDLLTLLNNLEALGEKSKTDSFRTAAAAKVLTEAEKLLSKNDFDNAFKVANTAKKLHPTNQQAAQLTTRISEARNKAQAQVEAEARAKAEAEAAAKAAALAASELTVGPQGNYKTITDALKAAKDGSTIKVQAGSYNETIALSGNVNIQGDAAAKCVINSSRGTTLTITGRGKISGLTLTNNSGSTAPTVLIKSGAAEISGCVISNATPSKEPDWVAAIEVSGGNPTIRNCTITSSKAMGITVSGGTPTIAGNSVSGCAFYGMWFSGGTRARVSENTVSHSGKSGIGIKNNSAPEFTQNTIVSNSQNGMLIYQNGAGNIDGNIFRDNELAGIDVWDAKATIKNNVFESNRKNGIIVRGSEANVKLGKNSFKGNSGKEVSNSGGTISNF